jgi:catalase
MELSPHAYMNNIFANVTGGDATVKRTDAQGLPMTAISDQMLDAQTNYDSSNNATSTQALQEMTKNEMVSHGGAGMQQHAAHMSASQEHPTSTSGSASGGLVDKARHVGEATKSAITNAAQTVAAPSSATMSEKVGLKQPILTSVNGWSLDDVSHSFKIGGYPVVSDGILMEKQQTFNRSKIVERAVHACGSGGHGYFECTKNMSQYTKAGMFSTAGKQVPLTARFSTVTYERGFPDEARNPRGLAFKFYTEEGNYDILSVNFPVFFCRDPMLGPDNIRSQQRNPDNFQVSFDSIFDWMSLVPESMLADLWFWSDHGTPKGWRFMDGYPCHTFVWRNEKGDITYVRYKFRSLQGISNLNFDEAVKISGVDPDYAKRDLWQVINDGGKAEWEFQVQLMTPEQAKTYRFDPFDCTRVWLDTDFPYETIGRIVVNKNPTNFHRDIEQVAFSPGSMIPGVEPSPDPLLQFRTFLYRDAQYYRLGVNFHQIPVNCPFMSKMGYHPVTRDGKMRVDTNGGVEPHYYPNSYTRPPHAIPDVSNKTWFDVAATNVLESKATVLSRHASSKHEYEPGETDYIQPRLFYLNDLDDIGRQNLISNIARGLQLVSRDEVKLRFLVGCYKVDPTFAQSIWNRLQQLLKTDLENNNKNNINTKAAASPLSWQHIEKYGKTLDRVVDPSQAYKAIPMPI